MERCAPSASPEAIPAEASSTQFRELPDAIQSLIVEKAAVISRRPEESAQNLAQLAVVNRAFRSFSHDIQETHPDIKQAGARARQKAVSRRISDIFNSARGFNHVVTSRGNHVKEKVKRLLVGEPHVGVDLKLNMDSGKQAMLLEILSEKRDMESLHFSVPLRTHRYGLEVILEKLEKINANNPKLHDITLDIDGNGWGDLDNREVQALVAVLKGNRALQSLSMTSFSLDAAVMGALADTLKENSGLHSLNLSGVPLDAAGMQALAESLKENRRLHSLNLSGVLLDAADMQVLAEVLKENGTLRSLDLSHTYLYSDVGGDAVQALAESLKENRGLHSLNLSGVPLDAAGMKVLADALKENSSLQSLDLSGTSLTNKGTHALAEALKKNKTLEVLDVSYNLLGPSGGQALALALKENETLHSLVLTRAFQHHAVGKRLVDTVDKDVAARILL